jgi:predicted N-formylglutamate amidohydrolase
MRDDAVERLEATADAPPILVTCEHASAGLPAPWDWPNEDRWLVATHWAYDIGAADLARALARAVGGPAVLSRFSRLLIDPNRPLDAPTLVRAEAEGRPVMLNAGLSSEDRARRLEYWSAYHEELERAALECTAPVLFAVHTFTPSYPGEARDQIEVGVLFDLEEELAERLRAHLASFGLLTHLNAPYSGKKGLIYAVDRHARAHGRRALEIEVRQDLAADASFRDRLIEMLASFAWPRP